MEILRFIKWQWNRMSIGEKMLAFIILFTLVSTIYAWFLGAEFLTIIIVSVCSFISSLLMGLLFEAIYDRWIMYKKMRENEAKAIVSKLRGY